MIQLLIDNPLLLLFVVAAIGYPLGRIRIRGINLDVETMLATWRNGAVLAGASAGVMVLCEALWNPYARRIETALGVVRGAAVIPPASR